MMNEKQVAFHEYRYQILPVSQVIQLDLDGEIQSIEDLKQKKNKFFKRVVEGTNTFSYSKGELTHKKIYIGPEVFILKLGVERDLIRKTREFEIEKVENWPTVVVAFNNNPKVQKCLVQQRGGFQHTLTVVKILENTFNAGLHKYQLSLAFEPIYKKRYFWDLVDQYKGKITQLEFELISPNMSNISASLQLDLGALNRTTNTQRTNIQLNSDRDSYLTPSQDDNVISGLVDYSSQGGGNISIRAKGIRKRIQTAKGVNEIMIDEIFIDSSKPDSLATFFKDLMK
jgi:hypothetical protein